MCDVTIRLLLLLRRRDRFVIEPQTGLRCLSDADMRLVGLHFERNGVGVNGNTCQRCQVLAVKLAIAGNAGILDAAIQRAAHFDVAFPVFGKNARVQARKVWLIHRHEPLLLEPGVSPSHITEVYCPR